MNKLLLIIGLILGILTLVYFMDTPDSSMGDYNEGIIRLGGQTLHVAVSETPEERRQGLSSRDPLIDNQGMFFIFSEPQMLSFWMKDMKFALDMIWVKGDVVVDITKNAVPMPDKSDDELPRYSPYTYADRVLEVNSGWADNHGVKVGDRLEFTDKR